MLPSEWLGWMDPSRAYSGMGESSKKISPLNQEVRCGPRVLSAAGKYGRGRRVKEPSGKMGKGFSRIGDGKSFMVTIQAQKRFSLRRGDFHHQLFSTTGAGRLKGFGGCFSSRTSPVKVFPGSGHLYPLHQDFHLPQHANPDCCRRKERPRGFGTPPKSDDLLLDP